MGLVPLKRSKRSTGVFLAEDRIVVTVAASTSRGPRELETFEIATTEGDLAGCLSRLAAGNRLPGFVTLGIGGHHSFYMTKELTAEEETDPANLLDPYLLSWARPATEFAGHQKTFKIGGRRFATIVACPRGVVLRSLEGLKGARLRKCRLEPLPLALHRLASHRMPPPKRWRTLIRVIVDGTDGLAVLSSGKFPLGWRLFRVEPEAIAACISSAVQSLRAFAGESLHLPGIDGVLLHASDPDKLLRAACAEMFKLPATTAPPVGLDARTAAFALALSDLVGRGERLNLFQSASSPPSLRDIFPWTTAAMLSLLVLGTGWFPRESAMRIESQADALKREAHADAKVAMSTPKDLKKRHKSLGAEVEVVRSFAADRILWASVIRELPSCLPEGVVLSAIRGQDSLSLPAASKKPRGSKSREISISAQVRVPSGEAAPPELPVLLKALAESDRFQQWFPRLEGAEMQRKPARGGDMANLVIRSKGAPEINAKE